MATKKTAPKKTAVKKAPVKKTTAVKTSKKKSSAAATSQSFRLSRSQSPFLTIAITRQTLYWGIIAVAVLFLGLWIINLQMKINEIYDAIDANNIETTNIMPLKNSKN